MSSEKYICLILLTGLMKDAREAMEDDIPIHWADIKPSPRNIRNKATREAKKQELINEWKLRLVEELDL